MTIAAMPGNRPLRWLARRPNAAVLWTFLVVVALVAGLLGGMLVRNARELDRLSLLGLDVRRLGIDLVSLTLNGGPIGATDLLGRIDPDIKREVRDELAPNGAAVTRLLKALQYSGDSDGGFVANQAGTIGSSFIAVGKSSTGTSIRHRPYFKASLEGRRNVYAAIGATTGKRILYFAAPVLAGEEPGTTPIGVIVARGSIAPVDNLLATRREIALLVSPQGVVFAANRPEWIGFVTEKPTPAHLKEIRDNKQFGALFDNKEPSVLPIAVQPGRTVATSGRFAVAVDSVDWNDPLGDWRVVLIEDLSDSVSANQIAVLGGGVAIAVFVLLSLLLTAIRNRQGRRAVTADLAAFAARQLRAAENKSRLSAAAVQLQKAHSVRDIADTFLRQSHDILQAFQGVVYVVAEVGDNQHMVLAASHACATAAPDGLRLGEGLLGECAIAGQAHVIETPPGGIWSIQSGLGHTQPAALLMAPVRMQDTLLGVVELAVLKQPDEEQRQLFDVMVELLALNLQLAKGARA
jgi:hypothetical protein